MENIFDAKPNQEKAERPSEHSDSLRFHEHSLLEGAVTEAARELQVSREMALMCAFGAMSTACQGHVDVEMPSKYRIPTSLMLLTIADSGERKTTTQKYFFESSQAINSAAGKAHLDALREYRAENEKWTAHKRFLERSYSKHASEGDEEEMSKALEAIGAHTHNKPTPTPSNSFIYEDTTPAALMVNLYENTRLACLLTSEASSIFSGKALGELDKLNTVWDGGSVSVSRISRESFILEDARLTMSLMAQPSVISSFMGKRGEEARGTGFLARFLVMRPCSMAGYRLPDRQADLPRKRAFNDRIRERLTSIPSERQILHFTEEAISLGLEYGEKLEAQMREYGFYHYYKDHASKLLENTCRLAAILHTFERESDNDIEIDAVTLKTCWDFAKICSRHFIDHLANEPQIVTDTNNLVSHLIKEAKSKRTSAENYEVGKKMKHEGSIHPPYLQPGERFDFRINNIRQSGPNSLRSRENLPRLEAAIDLLIEMKHIKEGTGTSYKFQETIFDNTSELKNGENITIRELPLHADQVFWKPEHNSLNADPAGYYIQLRRQRARNARHA